MTREANRKSRCSPSFRFRGDLRDPYLHGGADLGQILTQGFAEHVRLDGAFAVLEALGTMAPYTWMTVSAVLRSPPSPAVRFLQQALVAGNARLVGIPPSVGQPLSPSLFGLADIRGVSALPISRYVEYLDAITPGGNQFTVQKLVVARSPLLDLAVVRFVVLPRSPVATRLLEDDPEVVLVYADDHVVVYENRAALARVWIAHRATHLNEPAAVRAWLRDIATRGGHARQLGLADEVAVEPDEDGHFPPPLEEGSVTPERVRILEALDPDRMVVEATLAEAGLVVIADTYYPGWTAELDGAPAPIFPADLLFRAVFVPAGTHTLALRYDPRSVRAGVMCFVLGPFGCVLLARRPRGTSASPTN